LGFRAKNGETERVLLQVFHHTFEPRRPIDLRAANRVGRESVF
jgi:hypothetical protein